MTDTASHLDERLRRPSGIRSLTLGDTKLSYVPDGTALLDARVCLPDATEEFWAQHPEYLDEAGHLVAGVGGLLVERDGRALLIDAGFGPQTIEPPLSPVGTLSGGALLDNLAKLGRTPAQIEAVAFTHLHPDHIGWAYHPAPGGDLPAFTSADYVITDPEWTHPPRPEDSGLTSEILDTLRPRVRTVTDGEEIFPGVRVMLMPGHSAGHTGYVISAGGKRVVVFGDVFHSPVQIGNPELAFSFDHDRGQNESFRRTLITELTQPDTIGFGQHFADVVFGRVHSDGDRPAWRPVDA
ncbi:MBL fold metallo-hydrolase [Streptomyces sp. A012304]|uniref:MBL fold metallo-hydrolase n=1 Tax=Streptomyces sp. A012304 TaxID=375446 RepID=UPI0022327517|nr:MBL fold metallo-hydrolase [Streptomyces sp. A012304]GKQ40654.1 MBL fold hydrolase [Streptomyces sp. A012304]